MDNVVSLSRERSSREGIKEVSEEAKNLTRRVTEAYEKIYRQIDQIPSVAAQRNEWRLLFALCVPSRLNETLKQLSARGFLDPKIGTAYGVEVYEERDPIFTIKYDHPFGIFHLTKKMGILGIYVPVDEDALSWYPGVKRGEVII